jgi:hypothetical protein
MAELYRTGERSEPIVAGDIGDAGGRETRADRGRRGLLE